MMKNTPRKIFLLLTFFLLCNFVYSQQNSIDISGKWNVITGNKSGIVNFPANIAEYGFGEKPSFKTRWIAHASKVNATAKKLQNIVEKKDDFKWPYFLQPKLHFRGQSFCSKEVSIPQNFIGQRVVLYLERVHMKSTLFVNGKTVGSSMLMCVPQRYDISEYINAGKNNITLVIDNDIDDVFAKEIGISAHSISDQMQGNWNGIIGEMKIYTTPKTWIDDLQIYPREDLRNIDLKIKTENFATSKDDEEKILTIKISNNFDKNVISKEFKFSTTDANFEIDLGENAKSWSEFAQPLYILNASLKSADGIDEKSVRFGLRFVKSVGTKINVNGLNTYIRATLECCGFPLTGYPPMDKKSWEHVIKTCQEYGLNSLRFHSWCPPKAAFEVADELGFYFQIENTNWPSAIGESKRLNDFIYADTDAQLKEYGNHPSLLLYSQGNEPTNSTQNGMDPNLLKFLEPWLDYCKTKDSRHLYIAGSGWPFTAKNDFSVYASPRLQASHAMINEAPNSSKNYDDVLTRYFRSVGTQPVLTHEIGQWCAYPDISKIDKYNGFYRATPLEIYKELLENANLLDRAHDFLFASGKLQALLYKEELEALYRTKDMGGFQLLDLHDFSGQGYAPVGILDSFYDNKGYCSNEEWRSFCDRIVPLAKMQKLIYQKGEEIIAEIFVSNYENSEIKNAKVICILSDGQKKIFEKSFDKVAISRELSFVEELKIATENIQTPCALRLTVDVDTGTKKYINSWNIWVYNRDDFKFSENQIAKTFSSLNAEAIKALKDGESVWLKLPAIATRKSTFDFTPVFWSAAGQTELYPKTLGIYCQEKHPAFKLFPTSYHADFNWWDTIRNSNPFYLEDEIFDFDAIVEVIPDWYNPLKSAIAFEAKVGKGKLFITNINFDAEGENLSLKQLEKSFNYYVNSKDFNPKNCVDIKAVKEAFSRYNFELKRLGAKIVEVSSFNIGNEAEKAIDGNPSTMWHSKWQGEIGKMPHHIIIDLGKLVEVNGIKYMPRLEGNNGNWGEIEVFSSYTPTIWDSPILKHKFTEFDKSFNEIPFPTPITTRYIKIKINSALIKSNFASCAEFDIF